jgi:hypothetical protein
MTIRPSRLPRLGGTTAKTAPAVKPKTTWVQTKTVVDHHAKVRGIALWWSGIDAARRWRKGIHKVDFLVDGRHLWTDHKWPFAFRGGRGWNTATVANGRHLLTVRSYGRRGYRANKRVPVRVVNPPMNLRVYGVGHALHGVAKIPVRTGEPVRRVALYVDGKLVSRDGSAPYELVWDTRTASEGPHELIVYARGRARRAAHELPVVVANAEDIPASLQVVWGKLLTADG